MLLVYHTSGATLHLVLQFSQRFLLHVVVVVVDVGVVVVVVAIVDVVIVSLLLLFFFFFFIFFSFSFFFFFFFFLFFFVHSHTHLKVTRSYPVDMLSRNFFVVTSLPAQYYLSLGSWIIQNLVERIMSSFFPTLIQQYSTRSECAVYVTGICSLRCNNRR